MRTDELVFFFLFGRLGTRRIWCLIFSICLGVSNSATGTVSQSMDFANVLRTTRVCSLQVGRSGVHELFVASFILKG